MFASAAVAALGVSAVSVPFEAWRADPAIEMRGASLMAAWGDGWPALGLAADDAQSARGSCGAR